MSQSLDAGAGLDTIEEKSTGALNAFEVQRSSSVLTAVNQNQHLFRSQLFPEIKDKKGSNTFFNFNKKQRFLKTPSTATKKSQRSQSLSRSLSNFSFEGGQLARKVNAETKRL